MATANVYTQEGSERGTLTLPAGVFDCDVNEAAMHQAVVTYLANQRQGNASTKERSDADGFRLFTKDGESMTRRE